MAKATRTLLAFDKNSVALFEKLSKALRGTGQDGNLSNKEAFLIAMAWGAHFKVRPEAIKKSGTGPRLEYLSDSDTALMSAAHSAITGTAESLLDINEIHTSAELFAEGGIHLLADEMAKPGHFPDTFAAMVFEIVDGLGPVGEKES
jgi:hypothetical protein